MKSPLDGSPLTRVREFIFTDTAGGYLITNPRAIKQQFAIVDQSVSTREIKLGNLGLFPLADASLALLDKTLQYENKNLSIEPLLQKSQIPIYASADRDIVYIPPEGSAICRYFHELWANADDDTTDVDAVFSGFATLASYAGI
ncbi:MAG: hypothetical protein JSR44_10060 [Spirochaetes bacterium]|nr:hypothetical protein [Spirochaetota bacterium]